MSTSHDDGGWTNKPGPIQRGKQQVSVREKVMTGPSEQNEKLKTIGQRFRSPGFEYAGSVAIHIYKSQFGPIEVMTQNCIGQEVIAIEANFAMQQGAEAVAKSYGYKRPATRIDLMDKDPHFKNRLILETPAATTVAEPVVPTLSGEAAGKENENGKEES